MNTPTEPPRPARLARRLPWALALVGAALAAACFHTVRHDDAFITYRYGQNLALGRGLVFNPGERLMASTAPGHALLAAGVHDLAGLEATPSVMSGLGAAAWMLQALALFFLLRGALGAPAAGVVAASVALGGAGAYRWVALETNLAVAAALFALAFARGDRFLPAAVCVAGAGLLRPDAHLLSLLLAGYGVWALGWRVWKPALLFAAITAPWPLFALSYFGTVWPQSAVRKIHTSDTVEYLTHVVTHSAGETLPLLGTLWPVVLAWPLALLGARRLWRRDRRLGLLVAYGALHLAAYTVLRPNTAHTWHLLPGVTVFAALVTAGLVGLFAASQKHAARVLAAAAVAGVLLLQTSAMLAFARGHREAHWFGARHAAYVAAAGFLRAQVARGETVAAVEVGTLAYYADVPMHDWGGLVTPKPVAFQGLGRSPYQWAVLEPDFRRFVPRSLAPAARFAPGSFTALVFDLRKPGSRAR